MRVLIEGWDSGEPVRALLDAPDASQVRAAERVTLQFDEETAASTGGGDGGDDDADDNDKAKTTPPLRLLLAQQPHLLARSPPSLSSVVWDCGLALAEWLVEREAPRRQRSKRAAAAGDDGGAGGGGLTVVELGAGAGAPGLAAAASGLAGAALLTDVGAQALRGLRGNVTRNRLGEKVAVAELDWSKRRNDDGGGGARGGGGGGEIFDVSGLLSSGLLFARGSRPDLVLSADVCYPPPPAPPTTTTDTDPKATASAAAAEAEASAVAWAEAAAALCGPRTRVLVAFEARPGGVPGPEALRALLLREARARFGRVERLDASGMAFAGAGHVELYEFSGGSRNL